MTETIYWITRLDSINEMLQAFTALSVLSAICFGIANIVTEDNPDIFKSAKKWFITSAVLAVIFATGLTLIPTSKEMLTIKVLGSTIEYLQANDKAKELPDKAIEKIYQILEDNDNE